MRNKLPAYLSGLTDHVSIKTKLMVTFFVFIILPLALFTFITYNRVSGLVLSQTLASASQSFEECESILGRNFKNMSNTLEMLVNTQKLYELSTKDPVNNPAFTQIADYTFIKEYFDRLKTGTEIRDIRLYLRDEHLFSEDNIYVYNSSKIVEEKWFKALNSSRKNRLWIPPSDISPADHRGTGCFSYASIIYDYNNVNEVLGVLRVDTEMEKFESVLKSSNHTQSSLFYISDGSRIIMSNRSQEETMEWSLPDLPSLESGSKDWQTYSAGNRKALVKAKQLPQTGWYLVCIIPQKEVMSLGNNLRNEMLLLMLVIALVSYLMSYVVSNSSLKRLSLLTRKMRKVEEGDLNVSVTQQGKDEIGELMANFNKMVSRMAHMVEEKYKMGQEMKSTELKALQAQINPHFLYNSLDLVNCSAIKHNIPEIAQMVTSLAKFYKISLSRGMDIITLKEEITHVSLYVQIQNLRYKNRISYELDIEEEIYDFKTLKIILQPIVENSILHGILEKDSKSGSIRITGRLEEGNIVLKVQDDGVGMSEDIIKTLLSEDKRKNGNGYGIKNTHHRLQLYFGNEYGLTYNSKEGAGTTVTVRFPAV